MITSLGNKENSSEPKGLTTCHRAAQYESAHRQRGWFSSMESVFERSDSAVFRVDYVEPDRPTCVRQVVAIDEVDSRADGERRYVDIGGSGISATVRDRSARGFRYSSITVECARELIIRQVHFPYVLVPYHSMRGPVRLVEPVGYGRLLSEPRPEDLRPDSPGTWDINAGPAYFAHYPGTTFSQFLAWYDDVEGVYVGCEDAAGTPKLLAPVHYGDFIRLGVAHVVGWCGPGRWHLGYEVAVGPFTGDWHDAADIYRRWWQAAHPDVSTLAERSDVPVWLLDSPLHTVLRIRGEVDSGPAESHDEFTPYENALPLLDRLANNVDAPLLPVLMAWERPGPWVYPDCFPPAGGEESLRNFVAGARDRGWHVGSYCNGTQWVTGHDWTGYDGAEYFDAHGGAESVCRAPGGEPVLNHWDRGWRTSYPCCVASTRTRDVAESFTEQLTDLGIDWIQFLDQNCGGSAFGCYADDHGHPPAPGSWMTAAMDQLVDRLHGGETVYSVESATADNLIGRFPCSDLRPDYLTRDIPLYAYLFHEYVLTHATFATTPNPHAVLLRTAQALVMGDSPGVILGPGGRILDWTTDPWPPWDAPVGNQDAVLTFLRRALALRRDARDFLMYGRLHRDRGVTGVADLRWLVDDQLHQRPAVFAARWTNPAGDVATVLANWTDAEEPATVLVNGPVRFRIYVDDLRDESVDGGCGQARLVIPPLAVGIVTPPRPKEEM